MHCKFNSFTVALQRTRQSIYSFTMLITFSLYKYISCYYFTNIWNRNIYDASQVQPNRIFNLAVLVLPKLYPGYSDRLICLTLLRLVPSFIYVTNFPYENFWVSQQCSCLLPLPMMIEIQTIEGGQKEFSSLEGTT